MSKFCKKCGKEILQTSKKNLCESCQNKANWVIRKIGEGALAVVVTLGSVVLAVIAKGKLGGPKS
ncbi:MAG: hypothetical protein JJE36_06780 [Coriobacteriia bacterium]|nr:hypothetical protein [Coriobacteriia bacterium]